MKKYCGIKDIRVLFYSSIFQMIIVFPFIVLKYFSFCCHSSHSVLCCNRLVYSCFILIVKSDSKLILNSSCQFSILFHFCLFSVSVYSLFFYLPFIFQFVFCSFLYVFCLSCYLVLIRSFFPVTLSLLLSCLSSFCFSCYFVFMLLCLSSYFVFMSFCLFFVILSLFMFLSHFLSPYFPLHFGFIFTLSSVYFFDIFA